MTQADSVHSMPPINTSATRRRFLSQSAGMAAGGAILALATIPPASTADAPRRAAAKPERIFGLIEDHKAAIATEHEASNRHSELEVAIPEKRRRGEVFGWKVT